MTEFLLIPTQSTNGGRTRVRLNDIPRLFSEGLEEPVAPEVFAWQSLWQRFMAGVPVAVGNVRFLSPRQTGDVKPIRAASQWRQA